MQNFTLHLNLFGHILDSCLTCMLNLLKSACYAVNQISHQTDSHSDCLNSTPTSSSLKTSQQSVIIIKAHTIWRLDKPQTHNQHLDPECQQEKLNAFWLKRKALTETKRGSHSSADDVTVEMASCFRFLGLLISRPHWKRCCDSSALGAVWECVWFWQTIVKHYRRKHSYWRFLLLSTNTSEEEHL